LGQLGPLVLKVLLVLTAQMALSDQLVQLEQQVQE
jgi:hypothetical protein